MATKSEIAKEIRDNKQGYTAVIQQKIERVVKITKRALVVYATDFASTNQIKAENVGNLALISLPDKDAFDEITRSLVGPMTNLDVLIHSPGGTAEATESIVELLRSRFKDIRFIVPSSAKSAATMLAMSGNCILMDEVSELGPTDPQMRVDRENRRTYAPAQAIKDEFEQAIREINEDQTRLAGWMPILRGFGPSTLAECDYHINISKKLVSEWLKKYMFAGKDDAETKAQEIANYLGNHNNFGSHERRVGISELRDKGVEVIDMRDDPDLHEAVRDLYSAIMIAFDTTKLYKLVANSKGEGLVAEAIFVIKEETPAQSPTPQIQSPSRTSPQSTKQNAPQKPKSKEARAHRGQRPSK